jgi:ABC-type branched-subunit amino acid transport system substrate-binding protein
MRSVFQQFLLIPLCAVLVGAAPPKPGPASEAQDLCSQLVTIVGQAIREATLRAPSLKTPAANPWAPPTTISLMKPDDCVASATRLSTLKTMGEYLTPKDAKILVLLPLSGASADWGNAILKGLRQAFTDDNINLDTDALIIDTQSNGDTIERKFLETALTRPILATIGGATRGESERLGRWAGRLLMPTILFSPPALAGLPVAASKYIFRVGPSEADLARTLALKADHRRWKRIAVLRPSGGKSDGIIAQLQAELKSLNIESTIDVPYASIDYKTISNRPCQASRRVRRACQNTSGESHQRGDGVQREKRFPASKN